jgi:hypothetical protein
MLKQRSSTKSVPVESTVVIHGNRSNNNAAQPADWGCTNWVFNDSEEFIISENGRGSWHDCCHAKRTTVNNGLRFTVEQPGNPGFYYWNDAYVLAEFSWWTVNLGHFRCGWPFRPATAIAVYPSDGGIAGPNIDSAVRNECKRQLMLLLPGVKPRVSSLNATFELKDFASLPKTIQKISNLSDELKKLFSLRWFSKQSANVASDSFLQWKFNIAPLISDIAGFHRGLQRLDSDVARLIRNENKYITAHKSFDLSRFYPNTFWVESYRIDQRKANVSDTYQLDYSLAEGHVTLDYCYGLKGLTPHQIRARALMDELGINSNPAILWNAYKWTFAVDWLINVGKFLDQFKVSALDPSVVIYRACASVNIKRSNKVYTNWRCDDIGGGSGLLGYTEEDVYVRSNITPTVLDLTTSGLNLNEFSLATALATSKATKR